MNVDYLTYKYITLASSQLDQFKRKSENLFNFRCPYCGDSKKNRFKARAYLYVKDGSFFFTCHNCQYGTNFRNFLEFVDGSLYDEYRREVYMETNRGVLRAKKLAVLAKPISHEETKQDSFFVRNMLRLSDVDDNQIGRKYALKRRIPVTALDDLFFSKNFFTDIESIVPGKFSPEQIAADHPRVVIPIRDREGQIVGMSGRDLLGLGRKYYHVGFDSNQQMVYGIHKVDLNKKIFVFEGPIDSMFIPNSLAVMTSNFNKIQKLDNSNMFIVLDNERRNKEIVLQYQKMIARGYRVCLWPEYIAVKDVNDMVLGGYKPEQIQSIIEENSYRGLEAELIFKSWKRVNL